MNFHATLFQEVTFTQTVPSFPPLGTQAHSFLPLGVFQRKGLKP